MADIDVHLPEEIIRLRSYLIWQREGCPQGGALDHWLRAKAELEAEQQTTTTLDAHLRLGQPLLKLPAFVMPRVPISSPPRRSVATRIAPERRATGSNAAKR